MVPGEGWRSYSDKVGADQKVEAQGSRRLIESAFLNALNATNLIVLTGTGASFAARNGPAKLQPAGMKDIWDAVIAKVGQAKFDEVCAVFSTATIDENIERLLTLCKLYLELHENSEEDELTTVRTFVQEAERAILDRVDFIDRSTNLDAHSALIQKLGRRGIRKSRSKLFTTNYDLCFEEAARRHRFTAIDGFSHALDQVYDRAHFDHDIVRRDVAKDAPDYIENVFQFYKLHGSIDWRRVHGEIVRSKGSEGDPVLIYPRSSKYQESFEAPYLDMIGALQTALREPDTAVIVSGFGFRDDHISRPVLSALEANLSLRLIVCDPIFVGDAELVAGDHDVASADISSNRFLKSFTQLAESGDSRIHLINGRFEDMAIALPDLVGETDRERHAQRIRSLKEDAPAAAQ